MFTRRDTGAVSLHQLVPTLQRGNATLGRSASCLDSFGLVPKLQLGNALVRETPVSRFNSFPLGQASSVNAKFLHRLEACATRCPILFLFNKTGFYRVIYNAIHSFLKFFVVSDYFIIIFIQPYPWWHRHLACTFIISHHA